ncbi:mucin-associated surface protein [Arthrobacter pascens]|uniref:mucin-associated surface protein n=1 Tax=Arthrobacter pascens TaxID=1677 RepID=UPI00196B9127|nr:mucin-associated surface protein [Arthrobacter pascens]MBN3496225.1 mucin-associated surface protein [Arthrobacter pascens]
MRARPLPLRRALRRASVAFAGGVLALGLTGCGGAAPELGADAAAQLQQRALVVTKAAAGSDPAAALTSLEQLASDLDAAAADGRVSFKRHQSITAAVDTVRADLKTALAAKQAKAAEAAAKAATAASATTPAVVAPAPAPASGDPARGNEGKGTSDEDKDDAKGPGKERD